MRQSPLYKLMKTIPKGALHHDHFDCNEDHDFVFLHLFSIVNTLSPIQISIFLKTTLPFALVLLKKPKVIVGNHGYNWGKSCNQNRLWLILWPVWPWSLPNKCNKLQVTQKHFGFHLRKKLWDLWLLFKLDIYLKNTLIIFLENWLLMVTIVLSSELYFGDWSNTIHRDNS